MSEHHGGDMGGQQGVSPGMFPPSEPHHHHHPHTPEPFPMSDAFPPESGAHGPGRYPRRRYRPRPGSPGWVVLWVVRLAVLAFIGYVAFQVFHGVTSTP